jgi:Protein kinase domain/FG-GAP-like repeat
VTVVSPTPSPDTDPSGNSAPGYAVSDTVLGPGTRVGPYVLEVELGRGGMGKVFLAQDTKLDRKVAIKFVSVDSPAHLARFIPEARVTARCTHPNIVVIHDISDHTGLPFMVLEYLTGESLSTLLKKGALAPERTVRLMVQVARALDYAHSHGIIHRDLKPANVIITAGDVVKVLDFGIAKYLGRPDSSDPDSPSGEHPERGVTEVGELVGTMQFMAPEQILRQHVDPRSDLWAFGITIFSMLYGERPFDGLKDVEVLEQCRDLNRPMPSLARLRPDLPPALTQLVDRCLQKRLELRVQSAAQIVETLEALETAPAYGLDGEATRTTTGRAATEVPRTPPDGAGASRLARWWGPVAIAAAVAALSGTLTWRLVRHGGRGAAGGSGVDPTAGARVEAMVNEVDRLERAGDPDQARQLFQEFLEQERDVTVVALAWLERGDRERERKQLEPALVSYSNAYARATDPRVQRGALARLAAIDLDRWQWDRLAQAMDVYERLAGDRDAEGARLRDRLALATRAPAAVASTSAPTAAAAHALLRGVGTGLAATAVVAADLDGDGGDELITLEHGELVVRGGEDLRERRRVSAAGAADLRCVGHDASGAYAVAVAHPGSGPAMPAGLVAALRGGDAWQLLRLDGDPAPPVLLDGVVPSADAVTALVDTRCAWADLDGDGKIELYVTADEGAGRGVLFRVARDGDGRWQTQLVPLGAIPWDLLAGDLDGDGRAELVLALGEWRAYDVRVMRADRDGTLHVDDRVRLGLITNLASLGRDPAGRALIAAFKQDLYPSARTLPPARPGDDDTGLFVLALGPRGLEVVRHVAIDWPHQEHAGFGDRLLAADLDGDGRRDLLTAHCADEPECDLAALLAQPDGGFEMRVVRGVAAMATLATRRGHPDRVLARISGEATPWLLGGDGAGARPVPPTVLPPLPEQPPSAAARRDGAVAAAWRRAEELSRIGQVEAAADELRRLAALGTSPEVKSDALRRAAALLDARGLSPADTLEAQARLEPHGSRAQLDAQLAALDARIAAVEVDPARHLIASLLDASALRVDERARLVALQGELDDAPLPLFTGGPLEPPWRVVDPTLVHVGPASQQLEVETLMPGVIASVPLRRGEGLLAMTMTADITRTEWAGSLVVRLGPRDRGAPGAIEVEISGRGGGGIYRRVTFCRVGHGPEWARSDAMASSDLATPLRVEIALLPRAGKVRCAITAGPHTESTVLDVHADAARDWELSIEGGKLSDRTSATARITSLAVAGLATAATPSDPMGDAARALADHRAADALARLDSLGSEAADSWQARRLRVIALDEVGRRSDAVALLRRALRHEADRGDHADGALVRDLAQLLRAREGEMAPAVRAAFGDRVALVLHEAWANTAHHDLDEPRVRAAVIRDFDDLPRPSDATYDATLTLLSFRGEALMAVARPDEGRRVLADALALYREPATPAAHDRAEVAARLLAVDAATRGDAVEAQRWALRSVEVSSFPELAADMLLLDPATAALSGGDGWARIRELGRTLHRAP